MRRPKSSYYLGPVYMQTGKKSNLDENLKFSVCSHEIGTKIIFQRIARHFTAKIPYTKNLSTRRHCLLDCLWSYRTRCHKFRYLPPYIKHIKCSNVFINANRAEHKDSLYIKAVSRADHQLSIN